MAGTDIAHAAPTENDLLTPETPDDTGLDELDDEQDFERSRLMELLSAPVQYSWSKALKKMFGAGRTPDADADGSSGEEMEVSSSRPAKVSGKAKRALSAIAGTLAPPGPPIGRRYHEWDAKHARYREDWCAVAEYDPQILAEDTGISAINDRQLRRELAKLGLSLERHRRQDEGDVLDMTALTEYIIDRRTGSDGDHRIYETKRRSAHDLGVLVLLDATGSTGESDADGQAVFDDQRDLAARLTAALDELGIRVATFGFQSWGRNNVNFLRVKGFDNTFDRAAQRRIAAIEPAGFTRLGAAIRHGTHLLDKRSGTANKLLIVVGDGLPYDDDYEDRYAQDDCRKALDEAVAVGVACACVSVRTSVNQDIIQQVWGNVPNETLDQPSDLARRAQSLFRRALKEAAASRRRLNSESTAPSAGKRRRLASTSA
ncbi:VWA domain-containing protein [Mycobacterium syngnathidarum]